MAKVKFVKMKTTAPVPTLVVMLTDNDYTIADARKVFEQCRHSLATHWGMKEKPLPPGEMRSIYALMKECGKTTVLEVVGYDLKAAMEGARMAAFCGCDILMGTKFFPAVADYCRSRGILYFPFAGEIEGRPSVLGGEIEEIVAECRECLSAGADGIDLLGYRYRGDAEMLNATVVESLDAPVCIAGSIDSYERLQRIAAIRPTYFTIGSAFFQNRFGGEVAMQIDKVITTISELCGEEEDERGENREAWISVKEC